MASINGNTVTIPGGTITGRAQLSITTNSAKTQTVTISGSEDSQVVTGRGERTSLGVIDLSKFGLSKDLLIKLEYQQPSSDTVEPSKPKIGGPYIIGTINFLIIVAENGDDEDYNDCVCQIKWKSGD